VYGDPAAGSTDESPSLETFDTDVRTREPVNVIGIVNPKEARFSPGWRGLTST
jgi:hypothetical protein